MSSLHRPKRIKSNRSVFRTNKYTKKSKYRLLFEALLMLSTGIYILYLINYIPKTLSWRNTLYITYTNFTDGISLLYSAFTNLFAIAFTIALAIGSCFLLIGSISRFIIVIQLFLSKSKRKYRKILNKNNN